MSAGGRLLEVLRPSEGEGIVEALDQQLKEESQADSWAMGEESQWICAGGSEKSWGMWKKVQWIWQCQPGPSRMLNLATRAEDWGWRPKVGKGKH